MLPISFRRYILLASMLFLTMSLSAQQLPPGYSNTIKVNYVRTWDAKAPEQSPATLVTRPLKDVVQTTVYLDGLGRTLQTVTRQGSLETGGTAADMVNPVVYDAFGRETYKFSPFAANTAGGNTSVNDGIFKLNPFTQQASFMQQQYTGQNETYYYGQTNFEPSPLNRVTETFAPGNSWVGTAGQANENDRHSVKTKTWVNTATDDVKVWMVTDVAGGWGSYSVAGSYPAAVLYKHVSVDESGRQVITFTDKEERMILKKVQLTASSDAGGGSGYTGWLSTYYVYDDSGNLRLVIQPKAVEQLAGNGWQLSTTLLNELCFRYEYDSRKRVSRKKVPGAGESWMVYDQWDRNVLTQDANLHASNKWVFTKYDQWDRAIITGFYVNSSYTTQTDMQAYLNSLNMARYENYQTGSFPLFSLNQSFPSASMSDVLTITYYDDYSWAPWYGNFAAKDNSYDGYFPAASNTSYPYPQSLTATSYTRGLVTGVWDNTGPGLVTANYYDSRGRIIQTKRLNYTGGMDVNTTQYNFNGQPLQTVLWHQKSGSNAQTHQVISKVSYDDLGRLLTVRKSVSSTIGGHTISKPEQTVVSNEYNKLGQIRKKTLGNSIETLTYDYNICGWGLGVNRDFIKDAAVNKFGYELGYDKGGTIISGTSYARPQYNGNISGMLWKSAGDNQKRKYDYTYDGAYRLTGADFNQYAGGAFDKSAGLDFSVGNLGYDANGNILSMQQKGWKAGGSVIIDNLAYNYYNNSNRLMNVIDTANDTQTRLGDFRSSQTYMTALGGLKTNVAVDYTYDSNGNMVTDWNKDITNGSSNAIAYNYLNLPATIYVNGKGSIEYLYDAAGNKLKKTVHETGMPDKTTLYLGGFVYQNDTLQFLSHEEGRTRYGKKYFLGGDSAWQFNHDYFLKDHLGNVRMVLTEQQDTSAYIATLETAYSTRENQLFSNIPQTQFAAASVPGGYPTDNTTSPNSYVARVNGSGNKVGPALVLKVMSGDKVDIGVKSFYRPQGSAGGNNSVINDILASLATGIVGAVGDAKGSLSQLNNTSTSPMLGALNSFRTLNNPDPSGKPKAYLNWILLDEQFNYTGASSGAIPVGSSDVLNTLAQQGIPITKNGFLYVYVSNETQNWDVFFDNLSVKYYTGPGLEETHYYPYGLVMSSISSKTLSFGSPINRMKYNGKEEQRQEFSDGSGLELLDFGARMYDPQIGRWHTMDPLSEVSRRWSPYSYAYDNPVRFIDIDGMVPGDSSKFNAVKGYGSVVVADRDPGQLSGALKKAGVSKEQSNALMGDYNADGNYGGANTIVNTTTTETTTSKENENKTEETVTHTTTTTTVKIEVGANGPLVKGRPGTSNLIYNMNGSTANNQAVTVTDGSSVAVKVNDITATGNSSKAVTTGTTNTAGVSMGTSTAASTYTAPLMFKITLQTTVNQTSVTYYSNAAGAYTEPTTNKYSTKNTSYSDSNNFSRVRLVKISD